MKKLILLFLLTCFVSLASAQSEFSSDSISHPTSMDGIKQFGDFLLDMRLMNLSVPLLPKYSLDVPDASKDYNRLFRLNPNVMYSQGFIDGLSPFSTFGYGWGFSSSSQSIQMGSFRLKNGMRLNMYGDYDKDGWKVPSPNAKPWEKNNFRGAFELKSENGSFGIRIEMQQGIR